MIEEVREVRRGDTVLHSVRVGPPDCSATLLALHGGPGVSHESLRALDPLADDHRCIVYFDQRGVGGSTAPTGPWSARDLAEDVDAVRSAWGVRRVDLLGHSWGAYLAALYDAEFPGRVRSLVFSSPAPLTVMGWNAFETSMRRRIDTLRERGLIPSTASPDGAALETAGPDDCGASTRDVTPAYLFDPTRALPERPTTCSRLAHARTWAALPHEALVDVAARSRHAAVLVQGEGEAEGRAIVEEWTRYHAGPVDVRSVPGCGHLLHTECPDTWRAIVTEALGQ